MRDMLLHMQQINTKQVGIGVLVALMTAAAILLINAAVQQSAPREQLEAPASNWQTYENSRFGYSVPYPADTFTTTFRSQNGDGAVFSSENGAHTLRVFASHNALNRSVQEIVAEREEQFAEASARELAPRTVVLAGQMPDGSRRVERVQVADNTIYTLVLSMADESLSSGTIVNMLQSFTIE
jgi:hypothetical protein